MIDFHTISVCILFASGTCIISINIANEAHPNRFNSSHLI